MKDLAKILENLQVPTCEDEQFEQKLRRRLLAKYYPATNGYKWKFKAALVFSCLLLVFGCATIIMPDVAIKLNNLAFRNSNRLASAEETDNNLDNLIYTSIYNPHLAARLDPDKFQEDKAYLVRKYTSAEEGGLMIVSEFEQKPQKQSAKRISF